VLKTDSPRRAHVLCNAYVSPETDSEEEIDYTVEVNGMWDHSEISATYTIRSKTQREAAMRAIDMFREANE